MSLSAIKLNSQAQRGFTIVELLIVVVVIAILAAITIVSYNGITNNAKASAAQSAASTFRTKAEAYFAANSRYPVAITELTEASAQSEPYGLAGSSATYAVTTPSNANDPEDIFIRKCTTASGITTQATVVAGNISGLEVHWFDYKTGNPGTAIKLGQGDCPAA